MRKHQIISIFSFLILSFRLFSNPTQAQSSICNNDSTVIIFSYYDNDPMIENPTTFTNEVYHYNRDSGYVTDQNGQVSFWEKTDTVYNSDSLISEILTKIGSINGWTNKTTITRSYTLSGKLENEVIKSWNGASWDSTQWRNWQYDSFDRLTLELWTNKDTSVWINNYKSEITYTTAGPDTKIVYSGNWSLWNPEKRYVYTYSGTTRNTLELSKWDSISSAWVRIDTAYYQLHYGVWSARIYTMRPIDYNGIPGSEEFMEYDTLDEVIRKYIARVPIDTLHYGEDGINIIYSRINGILQETTNIEYLGGATYYSGMGWVYSHQMQTFTNYDFYGRYTGYSFYSETHNIPSIIEAHDSIFFHPNGHISKEKYTYNRDLFNGENEEEDWEKEYYYSDTNSVQIFTPTWGSISPACTGDSIQPSVEVSGGCTPYQFHWYPNSGLSSDTVLKPKIFVGDTTLYTLIVTDNQNRTDTSYFQVQSILRKPSILDETLCLGNRRITISDYSYDLTVRWYQDGTYLSSGQYLIITQPGNYYALVTKEVEFPRDVSIISCSMFSDTISITQITTPIQVYQQATICDGQDFYLPDSTIANVAGVYSTVLATALGCDSIIETTLTVLSSPSLVISTSEILCYGDSSNVIVQATGGTPPYIGEGSFILPAGNYTVIVTDSNGCPGEEIVSIQEPQELISNPGASVNICFGQNIQLGGNPSAIGGTPPYSFLWSPSTSLSSTNDPNPFSTTLQTINYQLQITDSNGCIASSDILVSVSDTTRPIITQTGITLNTTSTGFNYQWYYNGQLFNSGANLSTISPTQPGHYMVVVFDSVGCSTQSDNFYFSLNNINMVYGEIFASIYPNPAHEKIIFNFKSITERNYTITFTNLIGKEIFRKRFELQNSETTRELQLNSLSKGIYSIRILSDSGKIQFLNLVIQ